MAEVKKTAEFNEAEAIRLTGIAKPIIENDILTIFSSDEDKLFYEHFFINGMQYRDVEVNQLNQVNSELLDLLHEVMLYHVLREDIQNKIFEAIKRARGL